MGGLCITCSLQLDDKSTQLRDTDMAVWWVFQNDSYERSRDGGYLWAPIADKAGNKKFHWETMTKVVAGDLILSCKNRSIGESEKSSLTRHD